MPAVLALASGELAGDRFEEAHEDQLFAVVVPEHEDLVSLDAHGDALRTHDVADPAALDHRAATDGLAGLRAHGIRRPARMAASSCMTGWASTAASIRKLTSPFSLKA